MKHFLISLIASLSAASASAQIVVDGTKDAGYGAALAVQTVDTGFGDNFSELDAGYATINGGTLNLMLTGNVEANFNSLEIFIDSKAGGQSVFDSAGNNNAGAMDGLAFDAGFTADYHIIFRRGTDSGNAQVDLDFANLGTQLASGYVDIMTGSGLEGIGATGSGVNASPIQVGYDNSNVAGVVGGGAAANQAAAAAVTTGLELGIALSDLAYVGGPLRVMVGQNNSGHNYWSNQFLGGLPAPQNNLGGDEQGGFTGEGAINMNNFAGNQFFAITPTSPPGDFNGDLGVDLSDYLILSANLFADVSSLTAEESYALGDFTRDGLINGRDFVSFRTQYDVFNGVGALAAALKLVPEPGGLTLALGALFGALRQRCESNSQSVV